MTPEAIAALRGAIPDAFRVPDAPFVWPTGSERVSPGDPLWVEIRENLYPIPDGEDVAPIDRLHDRELPEDDQIEIVRWRDPDPSMIRIEDTPGGRETSREDALRLARRLREHFGGD